MPESPTWLTESLRSCRFRLICRLSLIAALSGLFLAAYAAPVGQVRIVGETVFFDTSHFTARFRGADLTMLLNRLTQEQYINSVSLKQTTLEMPMMEDVGRPFRTIAPGWRHGHPDPERETARCSWENTNCTVHMRVDIDRKTQDIIVALAGSSIGNGVKGITWGLRGLDLTTGRFVIPAYGGMTLDDKSMPESLTLEYPISWEANCVIWEGKAGGFIIYTRDNQGYFKKLHLKRKGNFAELLLETEAPAPWNKSGAVPDMMWRINTYRGDWTVPATGYRNLMNFLRPPVPATGTRLWSQSIRAIKTIPAASMTLPELDKLAASGDPSKTVLRLLDWRESPAGENFPNYEPSEATRLYMAKAKELGFRVMLPMHLQACSPGNPLYNRFKPVQMRSSDGNDPMGYRWKEPETDPKRYALITLASPGWRQLLRDRVRTVLDDLGPDAIEFVGTGEMRNDGALPVNKKTTIDGFIKLHEDLLNEFPSLVIASDRINEWTHPVTWLGKALSKSPYPAHPISLFLFGEHVTPYTE